jgi:hypothetical protein
MRIVAAKGGKAPGGLSFYQLGEATWTRAEMSLTVLREDGNDRRIFSATVVGTSDSIEHALYSDEESQH